MQGAALQLVLGAAGHGGQEGGAVMTARRKIIVLIATSADGYICRPDGGVEWLERPRPKGNYGMSEFFSTIDTILWGRKTFEPLLKSGADPAKFGPKTKNYVFSHNPPAGPVRGAEFVSGPVEDFARRMRARPGKHMWMMGGAGIIASFLDAGEIDEFIIHVVPIFIGEGIPLIAPRHRTARLHLLDATTFPDGVVRLHYAVHRPDVAPPKPARPRRARES